MVYPHDKIYWSNGNEFYYDPETKKLVDPFWEEKSLVPTTRKSAYFKEWYGLELSQVWNLIHGYDIDYVPKCQYCGECTEFVDINYGYRDFCDIYCKNRYLSEREDMRLKHSELFTKLNEDNNSDPDFQAYSHWKGFMSMGDINDTCYLYTYYHSSELGYKFGSTNDINHKRSYGYYPRSIYKGNRIQVGAFEYFLSRLFKGEWYLDQKLFKKAYRFIKSNLLSLIGYSTTIEQLYTLFDNLVEYIQADGSAGPQ